MCVAALARPTGYRPRTSNPTVLHDLVREHLETFLAEMDTAGIDLPRTVGKELRAYIACGDLSSGFVRAECDACRKALLIPFSCKGRTCCPCCGAKRMAATAAHFVDRVLPAKVAVRHWVLSLPFDLRFPLILDRTLLSAVLRIFVDEVFTRQRRRSGCGPRGQSGAIAAIHRADSALRVAPHFHLLVLDGAYDPDDVREGDAAPVLRSARRPTDDELREVARRVARRVKRLFVARGLVDEDGMPIDDLADPIPDAPMQLGWLTEEGEAIASGCRGSGHRASRGEVAGFSVYAGRTELDPERIERLARYLTRPPFANEQLRRTHDGRVAIELKRPRASGETHAFMTPTQFLRRIVRLIPPAGMNLTRYFGVLAPAAKLRSRIVPAPKIALNTPPAAVPAPAPPRRDGLDWASLLRRVYDVDISRCPCGGRIRVLAVIEQPDVIRRILEHLGLPAAPLAIAPARSPPEAADLFASTP